jgi:hypothetical protein
MMKQHRRKRMKMRGLNTWLSLVSFSGESNNGMNFEMFGQSKLGLSNGRVCLKGLRRASVFMTSPSMMVTVRQ